MKKYSWLIVAALVVGIGIFFSLSTQEDAAPKGKVESKKEKLEPKFAYFAEIESDKEVHSKGLDIKEFYHGKESKDEESRVEYWTQERLRAQEHYALVANHVKELGLEKDLKRFNDTIEDVLTEHNKLLHELQYVEVSHLNPQPMYMYLLQLIQLQEKANDAGRSVFYNLDLVELGPMLEGNQAVTEEEFLDAYYTRKLAKYILSEVNFLDGMGEEFESYLNAHYIFDFEEESQLELVSPQLIDTLEMMANSNTEQWQFDMYYNRFTDEEAYMNQLEDKYWRLTENDEKFEDLFPVNNVAETDFVSPVLSDEEVESAVQDIRTYSQKIERLNTEGYLEEDDYETYSKYYDHAGYLRKVIVRGETVYEFLIRDDQLAFAFVYEQASPEDTEYRYYYKDDCLIRMITSEGEVFNMAEHYEIQWYRSDEGMILQKAKEYLK